MGEMDLPKNSTVKDGKVYDEKGNLIEWYEGKWCLVIDGSRDGWWRYHEHYDRNGYCDNPGRGY